MKPYGLNGFTHEPISPQTSNDLGPINEQKSAQISHYWPHPKKFRKFGGNFFQQFFSQHLLGKPKLASINKKKSHTHQTTMKISINIIYFGKVEK